MGRKWLLLLALLVPLGSWGAWFYLTPSPPKDDGRTAPIDTPVDPVVGPSDEQSIPPSDQIGYGVASLAVFPGQPFPSSLPWQALRVIGQQRGETLDDIVKHRPLDFLEISLKRYEREIHGYRLIFLKRERIDGKWQDPEKLEICFRERPFSVYMKWLEGARLAMNSLYVEGENGGKLLARPNLGGGFFPVLSCATDDARAKKSGRYPINEFGLYKATQRTLAFMRDAEKRHELHLRYVGLVKLAETGNRPCYKLIRSPYVPLEEDNVNELIMYYDQETLLQVGSVLFNDEGKIVAEYFFRDIEINPTFDPDQFTRKKL